jgi:hypothetical protein
MPPESGLSSQFFDFEAVFALDGGRLLQPHVSSRAAGSRDTLMGRRQFYLPCQLRRNSGSGPISARIAGLALAPLFVASAVIPR